MFLIAYSVPVTSLTGTCNSAHRVYLIDVAFLSEKKKACQKGNRICFPEIMKIEILDTSLPSFLLPLL